MHKHQILKRQDENTYHLYTFKEGDTDMKCTVMTEAQAEAFAGIE